MSDQLFLYQRVNPTTWVYLSSLLTIALYFKFSRVFSVRNLDLIGLIMLAPGLVMVEYGLANRSGNIEQIGYIWLFTTGGLFMIRLLLDPIMVRRPLLEPNLSAGGMTFLGLSLFVFLMANVVNSQMEPDDLAGVKGAEQVQARQAPSPEEKPDLATHGPGYPLLHLLPSLSTQALLIEDTDRQTPQERSLRRDRVRIATARTMAILSHLAIVIGIVLIGYRHFDNIRTGIAAATLYLLLPYTAQLTGRVDHVLPAALLVWAVEAYRRPLVSGMLMGLAIGVIYYPVFLLPLWLGFYWQRGLLRFSLGVVTTLTLLVASLAFTSDSLAAFTEQVQQMFGWTSMAGRDLTGFWGFGFLDPAYRYPVLVLLAAFCVSLAIWPAQKNLGTLMSCSAAVMLATQFWHPHNGALYMAWYVPLVLLTIFRPNLEDRVALSVLGEGWFPRRRAHLGGAGQAA
ncbi:MAG: glycosyltransferase family 87 protein [Pirellulales bacterium]